MDDNNHIDFNAPATLRKWPSSRNERASTADGPYLIVDGTLDDCIPLHDWFNHLASGRGLCCSMADGETNADPDWESKEGHYRVRLDNKWVDVPDEAVITEPNRAGRTMVWPIRFDEQISIRCFMPGSMT
jgi:hypothetical protein